jgi:hypothetical protein
MANKEEIEEKKKVLIIGDNVKHVDENVIQSFIDKHGKSKLRKLELPMDDIGLKKLEVIVLIPNRPTMSQFMKYIDSNPNKAQEILINQCLLTSKEEVYADDALFFSCFSGIADLFPIRQATIKNL